jgi:hypothetical protein
MKATINQFILVAMNYPVAIVTMICLRPTLVNGFYSFMTSIIPLALRGNGGGNQATTELAALGVVL